MALLFDIFGFLTVVLDGLTMVTLGFTLGGIAFLVLLAEPLAGLLGNTGEAIIRRSRSTLLFSALGLALAVLARTAAQALVLSGTIDLSLSETLGATFVRAGGLVAVAALGIALVVRFRLDQQRALLLPLLALSMLGALSLITHGAARLDDRWLLMGMIIIHLSAAAVWLGGLPYFLGALALCRDNMAAHRVGARFSLMAMFGVAALFASGLVTSLVYIDSPEALYGTAYGAMLFTKVLMFAGLLGFGFKNMLIVRQLRRSHDAPVLVMRRFAEVELGVGVAVFLTAASLTSLPPAVDLAHDRVTWDQLIERLTPEVPLLVSPDRDSLAIPKLQAKLDAERQSGAANVPTLAYVPGAGVIVPPNATDIAWSEFNHHWAGIAVILIGLVALLERSGRVPAARHWPLLFLVLAGFIIIRSDPEAWPLGSLGFLETLRDPEVAQHRLFAALVIGFALFEWAVRTGRLKSHRAALVFPLMVAAGGTIMVTHSHSLGNVRQELLIEWTHIPIALLGIAAGWARWLELRLPAPRNKFYGWLWPVLFVVIGAVLLIYREA
jgi:putative copper resistance protein D